MPNKHRYYMHYRPISYWGYMNGLTNIKAEMRRRLYYKSISGGGKVFLPPSLSFEELSGEDSFDFSRVHREEEIARVTLMTEPKIVTTVRAWTEEDGLIHYKIESQSNVYNDSNYKFAPQTSGLPLTMGEIITLIDTADLGNEGPAGYSGLICWREENHCSSGCTRSVLNSWVDFVQVSSDFYPDLDCWYRDEAVEWYTARISELNWAMMVRGLDHIKEVTKWHMHRS